MLSNFENNNQITDKDEKLMTEGKRRRKRKREIKRRRKREVTFEFFFPVQSS